MSRRALRALALLALGALVSACGWLGRSREPTPPPEIVVKEVRPVNSPGAAEGLGE